MDSKQKQILDLLKAVGQQKVPNAREFLAI